jgi:hypothetical protein
MSVANVPVATAVDRSEATGITVHFIADANRTYRLERKTELMDTDWQPIDGVSDLTASTSGPAQLTDPTGAALTRAFYRVRLLLP